MPQSQLLILQCLQNNRSCTDDSKCLILSRPYSASTRLGLPGSRQWRLVAWVLGNYGTIDGRLQQGWQPGCSYRHRYAFLGIRRQVFVASLRYSWRHLLLLGSGLVDVYMGNYGNSYRRFQRRRQPGFPCHHRYAFLGIKRQVFAASLRFSWRRVLLPGFGLVARYMGNHRT